MNDSYVNYLKKYLPKDKLEKGMEQLERGVSPQYIVGNVDFYGNVIEVNSNVLIPRFETELLVERTIYYIKKKFERIKDISILDIGTGSGCIAITLKKELSCKVMASDISVEAITVAKRNAINNQVNIDFVESDIFSNINNRFDVIISNPPYIREDEEIEGIVKDNEPNIALYAKENGLYFYHYILKKVREYLNDKFIIAFEIGELQGEDIKTLIYQYLTNVNVLVEKDYSNRDRFVFIFSD